jgi:hypothetical protein
MTTPTDTVIENDYTHFPVRSFKIAPCDRKDIEGFIEKWHYSGSINGCITDYCFQLAAGGETIGAIFYGRMAMANQWKRFGDDSTKVIELRRLCCVDKTPKNTESYFIGRTLRWLKQHTPITTIVSYADAEYGHQGTIYKASNFTYEGFRKGAKVIQFEGKKYHDKAIRTKYKGKLKPFAERLKLALESGKAHYAQTAGKHCYVFKF